MIVGGEDGEAMKGEIMHPLTKLIFDSMSDNPQNIRFILDTVITDYLRSRSEWLKSWDVDMNVYMKEKVDTAFELSEKCDGGHPQYVYGTEVGKRTICATCALPISTPALPSKFEIYGKGKYDPETHWRVAFQEAYNQLIDYLHSKEARERER